MWEEYDCVYYEIKKFVSLLLKANPNVLCMLWLQPKHYLLKSRLGNELLRVRDWFSSKKAYHSFNGYAWGQFKRMEAHACKGYMGEKRRALVQKYGYDTKNASHLIRLLEMGIEFLTEGRLYVQRKNATKLLEIKDGKWSLELVKKEAQELFSQAREAYIHSPLPDEPRRKDVEEFLMHAISYQKGWF
jgi:predicted nucleotidyltransferase